VIEFSNGYKFNFGCASGALGFKGDGWWFEQPARWLGWLRPDEFTIITKTLTFSPLKGNLIHFAPWRAVWPIPGGAVNAVGLTNPGYKWWIEQPYKHTRKRGYKVIVSFMPTTVSEAREMTQAFNRLNVVGVQINLSCPNVQHIENACQITEAVIQESQHPVILKLSYTDDYLTLCKEFDSGCLDAFELINTVPFKTVYPNHRSPLSQYGYNGGVSGRPIRQYAVEALMMVKEAGIRTPIISGGGIESLNDVLSRESLGAKGFVFGSIFMRRPGRPNYVVDLYRKEKGLIS
jgi:dihydroorotate dehydrogenase (NAD+) catalytic subunit